MKQLFFAGLMLIASAAFAQKTDHYYLLKPDKVFDGDSMHSNWIVLVRNNKIEAAGPMRFKLPANTTVIELKGMTLLPGMIEGHSHLFLHPYNETSWDDQVLHESRAERTARAVNHARATLLAGFTTVRDLGTEGAMYDDVGLKTAIEKGIIPGPRMIVATRAIVLKGTYGPKSDDPSIILPQGAAEISTVDEMVSEVKREIENGADLIKVYADYRLTKTGDAQATFSQEQLDAAVKTAASFGKYVVAHATTPEGMRRAILAGIRTIEHGDKGTPEVFALMKEKGVALCPTLAAGDATEQYKGWRKGVDPETEKLLNKRKTFAAALKEGVTILMGGDVGVFPHGDNAREMVMMVDYGMKPIDVLRSATSINADVFGYSSTIGRIKKGLFADIIAVKGDPSIDIKSIRKVIWVMKDGNVYKSAGL
jgi:imidazolonepropionase-like amidohydrolase